MVHGPVLTRERAPRAARRRLGHNAREIRATPLFFLLLFHPESSARPCVGYLLLYSRYLDTFHDLLSFVTSAVSSSSFFFPLLLHGQRFSPRILLLPFHGARDIASQYVPDSTLSRIYAFLSLLLLTYPCLFDKISAMICESTNFIVRERSEF